MAIFRSGEGIAASGALNRGGVWIGDVAISVELKFGTASLLDNVKAGDVNKVFGHVVSLEESGR